MKILSTLFCFLLAIIAMPVLLDGRADAALDTLSESGSHSDNGAAATEVAAEAAPSAPPRARSTRSRRPARIDLTMPYYRFGRAPTRLKD
jgi:hypothetical protein